MAGRDLTQYMAEQCSIADFEIARDLKEKLCYVAIDFDREVGKGQGAYELPDWNLCFVDSRTRFECPEALFQPSRIRKEESGVHAITFESIQACHVDVQRELYANIVLSGGTTMFEGMAERMAKEL